jgi:type III secretion protein N (ATPase)
MDSVTRYARALRDVGVAVGEPPARRGFPPSVFSALPRLFERAGNNDRGSITAFYTVLLEDEEVGADPVGEEVRSLLDGHIVLARRLAMAHHYPAIDVLASVSRVMPRIATAAQQSAAAVLRRRLAKYYEIETLIQIGEYKPGGDKEADEAVDSIAAIRALLQQPAAALSSFDASRRALLALCGQHAP